MNNALDLGEFLFALLSAGIVGYGIWRSWGPRHMSSNAGNEVPANDVTSDPHRNVSRVAQAIAVPCAPDNDVLPVAPLPEDVRTIIREQAQLEALAILVKAGKAPQTEGIEILFNVKRNGRVDSRYGQLRTRLIGIIGSDKPEYYDDMKRRIEQEVKDGHSRR